jgi:hypothetical protein
MVQDLLGNKSRASHPRRIKARPSADIPYPAAEVKHAQGMQITNLISLQIRIFILHKSQHLGNGRIISNASLCNGQGRTHLIDTNRCERAVNPCHIGDERCQTRVIFARSWRGIIAAGESRRIIADQVPGSTISMTIRRWPVPGGPFICPGVYLLPIGKIADIFVLAAGVL